MPPRPDPNSTSQQLAKFGPKFNRLKEVLDRDASGLELRSNPDSLAPERLIVFEVKGAISSFARAIGKVPGLELIDEEELPADDDAAPTLYMMVPDASALKSIVSMWRRWQGGQVIGEGLTPWRDAFALLRDIRPWGASDRIGPSDRQFLEDELEEAGADDMLYLEVELVFRKNVSDGLAELDALAAAVASADGAIVSVSRIAEIAYHAVLIRLPVNQIRNLLDLGGIAMIDAVMHIRPQSVATRISVEDVTTGEPIQSATPDQSPILAILDGYPIVQHPLLRGRISLEDVFDLEADALVANRVHGTAMASLVVHGDRNVPGTPLPRRIHFIPLISSQGGPERFPSSMLIVDMVYRAVLAMRGPDASAPSVIIVNISLGNSRRPFSDRMSPWARLLDRLAYTYGILFIVSAGNQACRFPISEFATRTAFEDAPTANRAGNVKKAIGALMRERRIISPAETVNGLTVGGANHDGVPETFRRSASANINPYSEIRTANPSSSLGPGFGNSTKPDVLMSGAREHLRVVSSGGGIVVEPGGASRQHGLKVAAPPSGGRDDTEGFTDGTSAAAALISRTCHRVHDALEAVYADGFLDIPATQRAALLKALVVHSAEWPADGAALIKATLGPSDNKQHVRQKDNIRRFLGYGIVDPELAVSCTTDRATFWATGTINADRAQTISIPVPLVFALKALPHHMRATLAWFTPTLPGRQSYRSVRLRVRKPIDLDVLRIAPAKGQPDENQTARGTVFTRCWEGDRAVIRRDDMFTELVVQRQPHQGEPIDEAVSYGLAVTLTMPGVAEIYEQARQQLAEKVTPRPRPRP